MARTSDLVQDSELHTYFLPDHTVETVHTFQVSDPASGQRLVTRTEHWQRQKEIGSGGFGSVWLEKCIKGGRSDATQAGALRAVKQINTDPRHGSFDYNRELEAITKFSHYRYERCFVKSFGWYKGPSQLFIAMEYLELGDLLTYLHERPPLPEAEAKHIAYQILDGLTLMHENGFAHRDLKPHNILIKSQPPAEWWIKLADFGITKRIEESGGQTKTIRGTPGYIAPETWGFVNPGSAYATDIWALGEIIYEVLTKKHAFTTTESLARYNTEEDFPVTVLTDAGISQQGVDFVLSLMCRDPNDRMTAASAMSHEWIASRIPFSPESAKAIPAVRSSSPVTVLTEEFASWTTITTVPSLAVANTVVQDTPGLTTMPLLINVPQREVRGFSPTKCDSQHRTGLSLYSQGRYEDAEGMFQQAFQGREKMLGRDHERTLQSAHYLGLSLYRQKHNKQAEDMFRRALQGREKLLGRDHKSTLHSAHHLGLSLYYQDRYEQAEKMFQQARQGRERVLGHNDKDTLASTHFLGLSLYHQDRHEEAENMFRQALQAREMVLGHHNEDTLATRHYLGLLLYRQDRHREAESVFQRAVHGREKALGENHENTLTSIHYLGLSVYRQGRYKEAKELFRRAFQGRRKVLGDVHESTLSSRYFMDKAQRRALRV
ncbi:Tetratricopeptide-like helical [Penicillium bovifimosum]|uniref:Tetratricopeptide-like helical n=1 Tax=Penicillium bovifimosum TaxID=126998 RepID=A0A9W9H4G9_9EURO|nr:Tetratricopeptide-like helical [Penicillium bovifimosum]KAJ5138474.1 Tetratricopeptide-like helical [Penicillium bovifimosum]